MPDMEVTDPSVLFFVSVAADVFTREQAGRLFGFIAAGLSLGSDVDPRQIS
jgi:hypothetical protein